MIELKEVTKIYKAEKSQVVAIDGVSLQLDSIGMVFITGKSGCGKTTILNLLGALDYCSSGDIIVDGGSLVNLSLKEKDAYRNTYVGFIYQEYNLIDDLSVYDNIALSSELQRLEPSRDSILSMLDKLELSGLENRKPSELSGGQKQRVAVARALMKNPKIVLADEPTGALDSESGENLMKLLREISRDRLVVVVSHDVDFAKRYGDRTIELKAGKVIRDSAPYIQSDDNKMLTLTHSHMKTSRTMSLGVKTAIKKPAKLFIAIMMLILAVFTLATSTNIVLFNDETATKHTLYKADLPYAIVSERFEGIDNGNSALLSAENMTELSEMLTINILPSIYYQMQGEENIADVKSYEQSSMFQRFNVAAGSSFCSPLTQDIIDYFGWELSGRLPEKENEIVLSKYLLYPYIYYGYQYEEKSLDILTPTDMLNKVLQYGYGENRREYVIVGYIDNLDINIAEYNKRYSNTTNAQVQSVIEEEYLYYKAVCDRIFINSEQFEKERNAVLQANCLVLDGIKYSDNTNAIKPIGSMADSDTIYYFAKRALNDGECILPWQAYLDLVKKNRLPESFNNKYSVSTVGELIYGTSFWGEYIENNLDWAQDYLGKQNLSSADIYDLAQKIANSISYGIERFDTISLWDVLYSELREVFADFDVVAEPKGRGVYIPSFAVIGVYCSQNDVFSDKYMYVPHTDIYELTSGDIDGVYNGVICKMPTERGELNNWLNMNADTTKGYHYSLYIPQVYAAVSSVEYAIFVATIMCAVIAIIMVVLSILLLVNFINTSLTVRDKDIRVLKSLGLNTAGLIKIFLMESGILSGISLLIGLILSGIGVAVINALFANAYFSALVTLVYKWYIPVVCIAVIGIIVITVTALLIKQKLKKY